MKFNFVIFIISSLGVIMLLLDFLIIRKLNKKYIGIIFSIFTLILIGIVILVFNKDLNYQILIMGLVIFAFLLGYLYLLEYKVVVDLKNKNKLLEDYVKKSDALVENYSLKLHRYQNNLIVIKGYLKNNRSEADSYIDTLLDSYKVKKYKWFLEVNYIKDNALKYLIYYKLCKAEQENLVIGVSVSKDIKNLKETLSSKEKNIFLEILGEYFDNAIMASKSSLGKEVIFNLYQLNNKLVYKIANTYSGEVKLDLISKCGYTTKGKGHGLGLYDVSLKLKKIGKIKTEYELLDNYFIATLTISLDSSKTKG